MDPSDQNNNPASLSSRSHTNGTNRSVPMSPQDFLSENSEARITNNFFELSNENGPYCPYSEIYPIIFPQNEDDYFADNALMDMYKDAPLIEQIRSQENSQKEHQDYCDARQVAINNGIRSVDSEQLICEPYFVTTDTKTTLNYDHNYLQVQSSPNPPEVFSHSQQLNQQLSSPIVFEPIRSQENSQDQEHRECNNAQQSGMNSNAPISQHLSSSLNSEARVTDELGSLYSQIDFTSSANQDYD